MSGNSWFLGSALRGLVKDEECKRAVQAVHSYVSYRRDVEKAQKLLKELGEKTDGSVLPRSKELQDADRATRADIEKGRGNFAGRTNLEKASALHPIIKALEFDYYAGVLHSKDAQLPGLEANAKAEFNRVPADVMYERSGGKISSYEELVDAVDHRFGPLTEKLEPQTNWFGLTK